MKYLFFIGLLFLLTSCEEEPITTPDLIPEIVINWGDTLNQINLFDLFSVKIHNNGGTTTESSFFYVQKMDPVATIIIPTQSGVIVTEQATRWKIEITDLILSNNFKEVLFIIEPQLIGSASITSTVVSGTGGGETPTNNNIDVYKFVVI